VSTYDRIAGLPLTIERYQLRGLRLELAPEFTRHTTVIHMHGAGEEGLGEDVCYDPADHEAQAAYGPVLPLAGEWTLDAFSRHLDGLDLFPAAPPSRPMHLDYRRWAFESAALDLALRQSHLSLAEALGLPLSPVRFVVSTRLDEPATTDRVRAWLLRDPSLRFKLDPTDSWTEELIGELARLDVVDSLDLKGCYEDTPVDGSSDPALYRRLLAGFRGVWIEDPKLTPEIRAELEGHEDRVTWDAPIHSVDDIRAREWPPRVINVKPSRFGPVRRLLAAYDYLREQGIGAYGGGQTELGPGRGQIQYLASLFHPDTPNDVAPRGYNEPEPPPELEASPLAVAAWPTGFRWGS
jgi:hypothetical protein